MAWTAPAERSGNGAFGRTMSFEIKDWFVRAKAVSRFACHRSPKSDFPPRLALAFDHFANEPVFDLLRVDFKLRTEKTALLWMGDENYD